MKLRGRDTEWLAKFSQLASDKLGSERGLLDFRQSPCRTDVATLLCSWSDLLPPAPPLPFLCPPRNQAVAHVETPSPHLPGLGSFSTP